MKKEKRERERQTEKKKKKKNAKKNQCRFCNLLMSKYTFSRSHPSSLSPPSSSSSSPLRWNCLEDRGQDTGR